MNGMPKHREPLAVLPTMIVAFAGWADAAEAASGATYHTIESLPAEKCPRRDHKDFYDFTVVRPEIKIMENGYGRFTGRLTTPATLAPRPSLSGCCCSWVQSPTSGGKSSPIS